LQDPQENSHRIRQKALELGFLQAGMARADHLAEDAARLRDWLERGYHGSMGYMENHFDKRTDPRELVEGARSVVVVLQNYFTGESQLDKTAPRISKYAYGKDYHSLMRKKLRSLFAFMAEKLGAQTGRVFVDSAPVLERAWGRLAGLGWIGKHSLLLNRRFGSWFFIGIIISDLELEPDRPMKDYCGECTRCVDACPTHAILPGKVVDASNCISYLTIEDRAERLPEEFRGQMQNWAFGCDICQEVCPWNSNAHPHAEPWLTARSGLMEMSRADWLVLDEKKFDRLFEGSAVERAGYHGLRRNIDFLKEGVEKQNH
jgi:epoxyqueuosine reductase